MSRRDKGERKTSISSCTQHCSCATPGPQAGHTNVPWAYKCTIPIHTTPHTGIRLEQLSIPNACGLLCPFLFLHFLFLQVKLPGEVMTTDQKNTTNLG